MGTEIIKQGDIKEQSLDLDNKDVIIIMKQDCIDMVNILINMAMESGEKINAAKTLGTDILEGDTILSQHIERKKQLDKLIQVIEASRAKKPKRVIY